MPNGVRSSAERISSRRKASGDLRAARRSSVRFNLRRNFKSRRPRELNQFGIGQFVEVIGTAVLLGSPSGGRLILQPECLCGHVPLHGGLIEGSGYVLTEGFVDFSAPVAESRVFAVAPREGPQRDAQLAAGAWGTGPFLQQFQEPGLFVCGQGDRFRILRFRFVSSGTVTVSVVR